MKAQMSAGAVLLLVLCGCNRASETAVKTSNQGRYAGVGLYAAGPMWSQVLAGSVAPKDPAAARLLDDEEIIVAIDQTTGQIRQCGNLSGVCIGLDPWNTPLAANAQAPVAVVKHADQGQEKARPAKR